MIVSLAGSVIGNVAQYLTRHDFLAFCATSFGFGLFGAVLPVAVAYASDMEWLDHDDDSDETRQMIRKRKDGLIGVLYMLRMVGVTAGGIVSITMSSSGSLFSPLLVATAMNAFALVFSICFLTKTTTTSDKRNSKRRISSVSDHEGIQSIEGGSTNSLIGNEKKNRPIMMNILIGSILDNAGSKGLVFCMSPLMFEVSAATFVQSCLLSLSTRRFDRKHRHRGPRIRLRPSVMTTQMFYLQLPGQYLPSPYLSESYRIRHLCRHCDHLRHRHCPYAKDRFLHGLTVSVRSEREAEHYWKLRYQAVD